MSKIRKQHKTTAIKGKATPSWKELEVMVANLSIPGLKTKEELELDMFIKETSKLTEKDIAELLEIPQLDESLFELVDLFAPEGCVDYVEGYDTDEFTVIKSRKGLTKGMKWLKKN